MLSELLTALSKLLMIPFPRRRGATTEHEAMKSARPGGRSHKPDCRKAGRHKDETAVMRPGGPPHDRRRPLHYRPRDGAAP